jgi:hypothetical protein
MKNFLYAGIVGIFFAIAAIPYVFPSQTEPELHVSFDGPIVSVIVTLPPGSYMSAPEVRSNGLSFTEVPRNDPIVDDKRYDLAYWTAPAGDHKDVGVLVKFRYCTATSCRVVTLNGRAFR